MICLTEAVYQELVGGKKEDPILNYTSQIDCLFVKCEGGYYAPFSFPARCLLSEKRTIDAMIGALYAGYSIYLGPGEGYKFIIKITKQ